ncbi:MAG: DUF115 domain-containing protein [Spirochaetia bacterium]|nr:DUF115 domain-containing protein [Spirochaetia bacterium]
MYDIFHAFKTEKKDEKYLILSENENLIYTEKSLIRETRALEKRILEARSEDKILFYAAPYHEEIQKKISALESKIIWFSFADFTENQIGNNHLFLINSAEKWEYFINEVNSNEKYKIIFHPLIIKLKEYGLIKKYIEDGFQKSAVRIKTVYHFQKIWSYNYRKNKEKFKKIKPVSNEIKKADVFILGGPSVDQFIEHIKRVPEDGSKIIWCADTALASLINANIHPHVVFSIDAGYGSFEHFSFLSKKNAGNILSMVVDALSFPEIFSINRAEFFGYLSSNPLLQNDLKGYPEIYNETGDVYGCMKAVFEKLYSKEKFPQVIGKDNRAISYTTHLRGSAYHRRFNYIQNRMKTTESLFFSFSRLYGPKQNRLPEKS